MERVWLHGTLYTVFKRPPNTAKEVGLIEKIGKGSYFCAHKKYFGKSLFAWSYRTKIVEGCRKIKQLDLQSLGYEGFGTGVFACCMPHILFMQRSNITASTVFV